MSIERFCFVGLGNPGKKYDNTRHNIGFMWIDRVFDELQKFDSKLQWKTRFEADHCELSYHQKEVHLLKPQTFMNLSGNALSKWIKKYPAYRDFVVVCDDLDTELGRMRLRKSGGDGGNRGLRSIIERVGSKDFNRLKLGIGRPPEGLDPADYVLQSFKPNEKKILSLVLDQAMEQFETIIEAESMDVAMNDINAKGKIA